MMTRRWFVAACGVLLLAGTSTLAQSQKTKTDPITGTWTGTLIPQDGGSIAITLELKLDGKGAVSGTVSGLPNPADVKAGTFDRETGALKLELGKTSAPTVLIVLEGTVANATATGRFSGEEAGEFKIAKKP